MSWRSAIVKTGSAIREAVAVIDEAKLQIALVVNEDEKLIGTVTDGDVRRGIVQGIELSEPVDKIMSRDPIMLKDGTSAAAAWRIMREKNIQHIPVVDDAGQLLDMRRRSDFEDDRVYDNPVVLMAGGLGQRLRPLTEDVPKPLLKVGSKPILELILERFTQSGFKNFHISVNYKAEMVEEHFGQGEKWGVDINYLREDQSLGTAGALSMLPENMTEPVIVMNGDVLTKVNFSKLLEFHEEEKALATMCIREYDLQVPYGVVRLDGYEICELKEKPVERYFVNSGIYVLDPKVVGQVPKGQKLDMPQLFEKLMADQQKVSAFPLREYWMDIGQIDDYRKAEGDFKKGTW